MVTENERAVIPTHDTLASPGDITADKTLVETLGARSGPAFMGVESLVAVQLVGTFTQCGYLSVHLGAPDAVFIAHKLAADVGDVVVGTRLLGNKTPVLPLNVLAGREVVFEGQLRKILPELDSLAAGGGRAHAHQK